MLTDRERCPSVDVGIVLALALQRLYPEEFNLDKVNVLLQDPVALDAIRSGRSLPQIKEAWAPELERFKQRRQKYLLYPTGLPQKE